MLKCSFKNYIMRLCTLGLSLFIFAVSPISARAEYDSSYPDYDPSWNTDCSIALMYSLDQNNNTPTIDYSTSADFQIKDYVLSTNADFIRAYNSINIDAFRIEYSGNAYYMYPKNGPVYIRTVVESRDVDGFSHSWYLPNFLVTTSTASFNGVLPNRTAIFFTANPSPLPTTEPTTAP